MNKQNNSENYQTIFDNPLMPKRIVNKIVTYLNNAGKKSVNGGDYNYHKVYQVLNKRWSDIEVEIAYELIVKEEKEKIDYLIALRKEAAIHE